MRILIHHHKHGDAYYAANTPERKLWAFHRMFTSLDEFDAYVDLESGSVAEEIRVLSDKLASISYADAWKKEREELARKIDGLWRQEHECQSQLKLYKKAKEGDHAAAMALCKTRMDAEYEGFSMADVEEP